MKKFFKIATTLCLAFCLFIGGALVLNGCGNKEVDLKYGTVTRDPSQIGGTTLSFVYDEKTHTATFGGEGQQVAYYEADPTVGRNEAGNRVGIQITAPEEVKDLTKSKLTYNGKVYENGSFLDGDNYVWVYPMFTDTIRTQTVKIKWQENAKEQTYTIRLADGTTFAPATTVDPANSGVRVYPNQINNTNNYNGRNYNGYNRNVNRIRNNYNRSTNPMDVDNSTNGSNGLVNNGTTSNGTTYNGARTMPRISNGYYR